MIKFKIVKKICVNYLYDDRRFGEFDSYEDAFEAIREHIKSLTPIPYDSLEERDDILKKTPAVLSAAIDEFNSEAFSITEREFIKAEKWSE